MRTDGNGNLDSITALGDRTAEFLRALQRSQNDLDEAIAVFLSDEEKKFKDSEIAHRLRKYSPDGRGCLPISPKYSGPDEDLLPYFLGEMLDYQERRDTQGVGLLNMAAQLQAIKMEAMTTNSAVRVLGDEFFKHRKLSTQFVTEIFPDTIKRLCDLVRDVEEQNRELRSQLKKLSSPQKTRSPKLKPD